jgi:hypothetical protein
MSRSNLKRALPLYRRVHLRQRGGGRDTEQTLTLHVRHYVREVFIEGLPTLLLRDPHGSALQRSASGW